MLSCEGVCGRNGLLVNVDSGNRATNESGDAKSWTSRAAGNVKKSFAGCEAERA
jgi:hypothetical protein